MLLLFSTGMILPVSGNTTGRTNNGDAHLKAGLVGLLKHTCHRGEIRIVNMADVFLCEFDGPRSKREIVGTIISDR